MVTRSNISLIVFLSLLAMLISGCAITAVSGPAQPTAQEVFSPPTTEPVQPPSATEIVEPPPAEPAPAGVLRVVYIKDGDLWIWTEGSGLKTLPTSGQILEAFLSDDGSLIAFTRRVDDFHSEIWAIQAMAWGSVCSSASAMSKVWSSIVRQTPLGLPPTSSLGFPAHMS